MVHLHVRSEFSLLKGTMSIKQIIALSKSKGIKAICLSDNETMFAAYPFYKECLKNDLKPLFGLEMMVEIAENDKLGVNVIAMNNEGYLSLLALSSYLNTNKKTMNIEELSTYTNDCFVIILNNGSYEKYIILDNMRDIEKILLDLNGLLKHMVVGLINQESSLWQKRNASLIDLCEKNALNYVACIRILYEKSGDETLLQVLKAIDMGMSIKKLGSVDQIGRFFRSAEEMEQLYPKKALLNADLLAQECNVVVEMSQHNIIKFPTPNNIDSILYLKELCYAGLKKRLNNNLLKNYVTRLEYELSTITTMHFEDYFLIVHDYVKFARSKHILVGAGRGSAAGSLVAYVLGITHADPIKYDLLFERFLNIERISMPDIDIDFPDNRREEVIAYVKDKYGTNHVAHLATFGTLKAKQVLRDVGRVLDIPINQIDLLNKKIPSQINITLTQALELSPTFKQLINSKAELKELLRIAMQLEGKPRHLSTHAAGIIISKEPLVKSVPLIQIEEDMFSTQYPADCLEELGLLKMDFLGLRNLSIIDEVLHEIKDTYDKDINIMQIDLTDQKTLALLKDVDTVGVFQLESDGMKQLLKKMKVETFDDVVVTIALFRPGPMENIPEYLKRREEKLDFSLHPSIDYILKPTYGIMIYQEQIMLVCQVMASFSLSRADVLRRAMSKKKEEALLSLKEEFVSGALKNGYEMSKIEEVYNYIMKFANYGFNKSHSVAYGMIAFQMAYLKANYPLAFFKALLNSVIGSESKTIEYIDEAKRKKLKLFPMDINKSSDVYLIEENGLRLPLALIKNVGNVVLNELKIEISKNGYFTNYFDFVARANKGKVNRSVIENLIDGGALDCFKHSRFTLLQNIDEAMQYGNLVRIEETDQIRFNFDLVSQPIMKEIRDNLVVKCEREKNVLGFYFSTNPISIIRTKLNLYTKIPFQNGYSEFLCVINHMKMHRTKQGELMAFLSTSDESQVMDVVLMPNLLSDNTQLQKGDYIVVNGKLSDRGSVLANKIKIVNELLEDN